MMREIIGANEGENQEVQLAKLNRMQQYAEAQACRRKILLNYFSEDLSKNCGNCDVCQNPPESFDGTTITQKALSAIYRLKQSVGMTTLIEVLRGSGRREILSKGYQNIKTYGAGRNIPYMHWQQYLLQMLNLGFIEIAFHDKNQVRLTPSSKQVLFEGRKVQLVRPETIKKREDKAKAEAKKTTQKRSVGDELFQVLRQLRKRLAQERGIPPYRIFSDATLMDMIEKRPMTSEAFLDVMGVGEQKLETYGDDFIDAIINFVSQKTGSIKGSTYQVTLGLLKQGQSLEEIAKLRDLNLRTIMTHIAHMYELGHPIDISPYITQQEIDAIKVAFQYVEKPVKMKDIFLYFDEQYSYDKIRLTQAYLRRSQQTGTVD